MGYAVKRNARPMRSSFEKQISINNLAWSSVYAMKDGSCSAGTVRNELIRNGNIQVMGEWCMHTSRRASLSLSRI